MPSSPSDNPTSALKTAYQALPEETKRRISRTFFERKPGEFATLAKWAKTGYYNVRVAAQRPAGVGARLDDYLLRSQNGYHFLRQGTNHFFFAEKKHWVDFVRLRAHHETPTTIGDKMNEILAAPDAPWRGDSLEAYFKAAACARPIDWLPEDNRQTTPPPPLPPPARPEPLLSVTPITYSLGELWEKFDSAEREILSILDRARAMRPFDHARISERLKDLAAVSDDLRRELATLLVEAGQQPTEWTSAADFKMLLEQLSDRGRLARAKVARQQLNALANQLDQLIDGRSRSERRREEIKNARVEAVIELRALAAKDNPPNVPGECGSTWLPATFGLTGDEYDIRLRELESQGFFKLAAFIHLAEDWNRFTIQATESEPSFAQLVCTPNVPSAREAPLVSAAIATAQSVKPTEGVAIALQPVSAPSHLVTEVPKPASRPTAIVPDMVPGWAECVDTLYSLDLVDGASVLLPDVVGAQPTDLLDYLPTLELWRAVACQPWLGEKENDVHEILRRDLSTLVESGWTARTEFEAVIAWAAIVYPAFLGSVPQATALIYPLTQNKNLPTPFAAFTRLTGTFLSEVPHCSPEGILKGTMHSGWSATLDTLRADIIQFCDSAPQQTLNYQKATHVWRKVNAPGGRLREIAQRTVGKPVPDILKKLRGEANDLLLPKIQQRLIEAVGHTISNNFPNIDGAALEQLSVRFEEFAQRILRFCDHASREPKESLYTHKVRDFSNQGLQMLRALSLSASTEPDSSSAAAKLTSRVVHRAAQHVLALFGGQVTTPINALSYDEALVAARLRVVGLPLDPRTFTPREQRDSEVRAALRPENFKSFEIALKGRLDAGEIACARRLLDESGATTNATEWIVSIEDTRESFALKCKKEIDEVRRDVLNARMLGVMDESIAQEHLTRLTAAQSQILAGDDFATPLWTIRQIKSRLQSLTAAQAAKLNDELAALPANPPESRLRVDRLLQSGDLATAREYITRLQTGLELPPLGLDESLGGFTQSVQTKISDSLASGHEIDGLIKQVQARANFGGLKFEGLPSTRQKELIEWLQAWRGMRAGGGLDRDMVMHWLRGLGFRPIEVRTHSAGSEMVADVKMDVIADRTICPVPQFGSDAKGSYRFVHLVKRQDAAQYLQILRQAGSNQAIILLAAYRVDTQMRLEYARICREHRLRGLLVDEVLVTYLASLHTSRLAGMFKATLPYTWVDPYVPTSSFVPPEMFFGRAGPLDALLDMSKQRCFVYGGRQLGKTALLREVERRFPAQYPDGTALWIDLQAEDFGITAEPEEIWVRLNERFAEKVSGFEALWRETKGSPHARFESALGRWLERDPQRRLLLLLDECDRFFEREASHDFPQTRRLKDLMGRWSGRLKIVFAGLHNVQRSIRHANHPLAHLGDPINVGAFSQNGEWMEAYALVAGPLAALGFRFKSADLPSRVLAACNFYPSLLQQFGHRMLDRFRNQPRNVIPREIDAEAIDAVIREDEFRRFMTDRFQLTLQLDRRYYYIAYAFAVFFHDEPDRSTKGYTAGDLRDKMEYWRPAEFAHIGHEEFDALLDEMLGLGILQRGSDQRYRLRNTNVLLLLGTEDEVIRRLAEDLPELKIDFQSQSHRGRVADNRRRFLTRPEENRLLDRKHQISLFSYAPVAESAAFEESLRTAAQHDKCHFVAAGNAAVVKKALEERAGQKLGEGTHVILLDRRAEGALPVADCIELAREFVNSRSSKVRFFSVAIQVPVGQLWDLDIRPWLSASDLNFFFARRWESEFVGPWLQDQSFSISMSDLGELMAVTDGWPRLLHDFVSEYRGKHSWPEALESVRKKAERWAKDPGVAAKFVGEGPSAATAWKHLRDLYALESGSFTSIDATSYAELQDISPALMQHWIEIAARLGMLDRTTQTYRWSRVFSQVLAGQ